MAFQLIEIHKIIAILKVAYYFCAFFFNLQQILYFILTQYSHGLHCATQIRNRVKCHLLNFELSKTMVANQTINKFISHFELNLLMVKYVTIIFGGFKIK